MGVYIEGLDRPRNEYMRIHIDFDGEVWVFRGSGWESLGIKATNLDLVRCGECKHWNKGFCNNGRADANLRLDKNCFCDEGEGRADEHTD